jgi:hypothetical protein
MEVDALNLYVCSSREKTFHDQKFRRIGLFDDNDHRHNIMLCLIIL